MAETAGEMKASFEAFVKYYDGLISSVGDTSVSPPMSYDPSFLGNLSSASMEGELISMVSASPSYSESAVMESLLVVTSSVRDIGIRKMSRADYYLDAEKRYEDEKNYYTFLSNINSQFLTGSTPLQKA